MELRQLEYFMAICEELHFTRASEKLGITQPTLSHQIKALEDEIGVPLFDRIGKKISVTEAGIVLKEQCSKVFSNLKSALEEIQELKQIERGKIFIGALPGEINQLVSSQLLNFHRLHPDIQIKIVSFDDIVDRVIQNEIDLAVTIMPLEDNRVAKIPLYREEFYLAVSHNHPLAAVQEVDFKQLNHMPIVMFPQTHQCRKMVDVTCTSIGFDLQPIIETNTVDSIISLVEEGAGATILSGTLLSLFNRDEQLKVIKIVNPTLCRQIGIVYHKDKYLGFAARQFIELLTGHIRMLKFEQREVCEETVQRKLSRKSLTPTLR